MDLMAELKKFMRFLGLAILLEASLAGAVWVVYRTQSGDNPMDFASMLSLAGGVAMVVGLFSLIEGMDSFKKLKHAINPMGAKKTKDGEIKPPDFSFFLMMLFVGSVAIGIGEFLQRSL